MAKRFKTVTAGRIAYFVVGLAACGVPSTPTDAGPPLIDGRYLADAAPGDSAPPIADAPDLSEAGSRVSMPIEVLGEAGTIESITLVVGPRAAEIDVLSLYGHRLGYANGHSSRTGETKASVRLNGGPWTAITNDSVDWIGAGASYGGIGGGYHTLWVDLPAGPFEEGANSVEFRFEGTDGRTSGYRILDLKLKAAGEEVPIESTILLEDPAARDPLPSSALPVEGERLWYARQSLTEPMAGDITASCSDCHADDGRDLAYFHFSNRSIISRALFHGLEYAEGEAIAAYIRSLDTVGSDAARPWTPPYQPGPGLDARPVEAWAAGAGLGAVLASDAAMLEELRDDATSFDTSETMNIREMRIAMQFPDWNAWLPAVHPVDIWGASFRDTGPGRDYVELAEQLGPLAEAEDPGIVEQLGRMDDSVRRFIGRDRRDDTGQGPWRTLEGAMMDALPESITRERAKLALSQWMGVKTWELVQANGLEALPPVLRPPLQGVERGEARGWPTDGQSVWANAPHMTADDKRAFQGQSEVVGLYESSVWYQLQLTLNASMRLHTDTRPMDWAYHHLHMVRLADISGEPQALRYVQSFIKAYQSRDNGLGPTVLGFQLRFLHPWQMYATDRGETTFFDVLDSYEAGLHGRVLDGLLTSLLDMLERRAEFSIGRWPRRDPIDYDNATHQYWFALEREDYRPTAWSGSGDVFEQPRYNHADAFYRLIPRLAERGVRRAVLERLVAWCERAWPEGDWESLL